MNATGGRRVAVTRDEGPEGPLALALRDQGLLPISCPAVTTLPPQDPGPLARAGHELENYDWLVAASVRAVDAVLQARAGRPFPKWVRTAAVGRSTAAALRTAGADSILVAAGAGAESLIPLLADAERWERVRVLLPRAAEGGRELADALRAFGARVDDVVAYRTRPRPGSEIAWSFRRSAAHAAVITSPSAARALVAALGAPALQALHAVVAIGPTTAHELERLGVEAVVSERTDFAAVAERTRRALDFMREPVPARSRATQGDVR